MDKLIPLAKTLRKNQTYAENLLWLHIKNRQILNINFRRQRPLGKYIVDFISREHKLIIEIDGGHHNDNLERYKDEVRTKYLESQGYKVIRFWNNEVSENLEGVLEIIRFFVTSP